MENPYPDSILISTPSAEDAKSIWRLVEESKTLDHNSFYCYFLLCSYFKETCAVAKSNGAVVGFAIGLRSPLQQATLFIWQILVREDARGKRVGLALLSDILRRPSSKKFNTIEATIAPNNTASQALFASIAKKLSTTISQPADFLGMEQFPPEIKNHEPEFLYRVGPFIN
ncbi:MAG: diaminobutyrate acetyltransferase [Anaerolineaceae bacterium]|nr:diaminobutyrate acetyltransferase [Anaerolineaceae bacterium]